MNIALIIGKKNSVGVPGKNLRNILGRPSAEYAFIAAKFAKCDRTYVSTDSDKIASIGKSYNATHISRPSKLAKPDSLTEDVLLHAYQFIINDLDTNQKIDTISLLFCNNPAINVDLLKQAIKFTSSTVEFDSCFSVAKYDMFSISRARKLNEKGQILSFIDLSQDKNVTSIRDSQGTTYFCDLSIQVMKPICFTDMENGPLPFKWQGK